MKIKRTLTLATAALLGSAFLAVFSQTTQRPGQARSSVTDLPLPSAQENRTGPLRLDPESWEVLPSEPGRDVSDLNTPEQVEERARAALAIQRPAEYSRLVRKDAAQLKAEAEAADVILHPESYRSKSRDGGVAAP